jgi:predicted RNA binding protein YcfA (HicA-like mRNA interferase family)
MAAKQRRIRGKELISILQRLGFAVTRIKGSHHFLKHADGRCTTVPVHSGEEIGTGLLSKILRDVELTKEELEKLV